MEIILDFAEQLPKQCPPAEASDAKWEALYRLVSNESPTHEDFKSYAALGKEPTEIDDLCRWASCSLFVDISAKKKLPTLKGHHWAAKLAIPVGCGMSKKKKNHVDFWRAKNFDMATAVVEIVKL